MLALLAEAYGRQGDSARGLRLLDKALEMACATGERHYEAELYRLQGLLLMNIETHMPGYDTPERYLRRAVSLARTQGARGLELRAAISLCRLLDATGRPHEGRDDLITCYSAFDEGFETPDLQEARSLIEQLSLVPSA
jgi:adenylate cyclase